MTTTIRIAHIAFGLVVSTALVSMLATPPSPAKAASTIPLCEIQRSLSVGLSGEDVHCLQRYLNWSGATIASSGAGSAGNETFYYGPLTAAAVARWQSMHSAQVLLPAGLTSGTGFWGPVSFSAYVTIVRAELGV